MKFLITAFNEFGQLDHNSSKEILKKTRFPENVHKAFIDVSLDKSFEELKKEIEEFNPDIIILTGQAGNYPKIHLEKRAQNLLDFKIPDIDNKLIINKKIDEDGEDLYTKIDTTSLDIYLNGAGINTQESDDAGTYICNYLYYEALKHFPDKLILFVHFPLYIGQTNLRYQFMQIDEMVRGLELIVSYLSYSRSQYEH